MDDPFSDIVAEGPSSERDIRVSCKCKKGSVNVYDLDPLSGGGWECPWCEYVISESAVNAAIDEYEENHGT